MTKKRMSKTEAANNAIEVWAWAKLAMAMVNNIYLINPSDDLASGLKKDWDEGMENKFRALAQYVMNK